MKKWIYFLIGVTLMSWAGAQAVDLSRQVRVYVYRPDVFADRSLGVGLPADTGVLRSFLWYVRMDESVRSLAGMEELSRFVRSNGVPGLDFTNHWTLTNTDLETLFRPDIWNSWAAYPGYKFLLLKLSSTETDDRAMPTIARLYDLVVLHLCERVSDEGMKFLPSLKQLRVLRVPGSFVTDKSAALIAQLPHLEYLSLAGTQITDEGLKALTALPLRQIDLEFPITDRGLEVLAKIPSLEQLDMHLAQITGQGLAHLTALPIHTLFLGPYQYDKDIPVLAKFKKLKRLDLSYARLTDASLATLAQMSQLEELALTHTGVTDKALDVLSRLPNLRYLEISETKVTPESFKTLTGFPALRVISFSSSRRLKPADLKPFGRLVHLHSILLNNHLIGPDFVHYLQQNAQSSEWWDRLVPFAFASGISDADVDKVLEVASAPEGKSDSSFKGVHGLELIHDSEASLNEVIPAPNMINVDNQQDTEKNFLGEITVGVGIKDKKKN